MANLENERDTILNNALQRIETQAPKDVSLSGRGVKLELNTITKEAGVAGWNADAFSLQNSTGNAYVSAQVPSNDKELIFGLNEDPGTTTDHASVDFAWHLHADGTLSIVENGQMINFTGGSVTNPGGTEGEDTAPSTGGGSTVTGKTMHWYGDSFTWGYDGSTGNRLPVPVPAYVDSRTDGLLITNYGANSTTIADAIAGTRVTYAPWKSQMLNTTCDIVIIAWMFNDQWNVNTQTYRDQLRTLYQDAVDTGKTVIFQTCHYCDPVMGDLTPMVTAMKAEAVALGIRCIDLYTYTKTAFTGSIRDWVPDGYHFTQAGANLIGEYLVNQFLTYLPGVTATGAPGTGGGGEPLPPPTDNNVYPQSGTIAYFGESCTYGMGPNFTAQRATTIPKAFDTDLSNFTVSNEGVVDKNSRRMINGDYVHPNLDTWLAQNNPTYVILQLGLWEHYIDGGVPVAEFGTNLQTITEKVRADGAIMIFQTTHENNLASQNSVYRTKMIEMGTTLNVPVIDLYSYSVGYRQDNGLALTDLVPDGRHGESSTYSLYGAYCALRFKQIIGAS